MIKAIAFDLWETLITDTPELSRRQERLRLTRLEEILSANGHPETAERLEHAHGKLWHRCHELYWSADRDVPCRTQIEHFLEVLGIEPASLGEEVLAELERAYAGAALEVLPAPVDGANDLLREVRSRDLRVGLISNTGRTPGYVLRDVLDRLELAPSIDAMVFSNEHGECKPRASIFERLGDELGVRCDEIVFVGDNLYVDVWGAQRCGMQAVHFVPAVRGTAVAPPVDHDLEIAPDAVIRHLSELPAALDGLQR